MRRLMRLVFTPPAFPDRPGASQLGRMIYSVVMISAALLLAGFVLICYLGFVRNLLTAAAAYRSMSLMAVGLLSLFASLILLRAQHISAAGWILFLTTAVVIMYPVLEAGGVATPVLFANFLPLIVAALVLRKHGIFLAAGLLTLTTIIVFFSQGQFPGTETPLATPLSYVLVDIFVLAAAAFLLDLQKRTLNGVLSAAVASEADLRVKSQMQESRTRELENRVEEQKAELRAAAVQLEDSATQFAGISDVARSIAGIQDLEVLLPRITRVVSGRFGYYHAGIFLVDESREFAVLRAANSEGGQRMLKRTHKLRVGAQGIVGYVAQAGAPRVAADVGKDAVFFDNPDLPETHSELGLPLTVGDRIIGVLDVQSRETAAFEAEDVEILSALASQIAIAIENSRLFTQTSTALAELKRVTRQSTQIDWEKTRNKRERVGYRYDGLTVESLPSPVEEPGLGKAAITGESATTLETLAVPIKVHGQTIGVLGLKSLSEERLWHPDEIAIAEAAADRVGLALENARLLDETSRRAERERTVAEITNKVRATNDPQVMIETAMRELREVLGASQVRLSLAGAPGEPVQAGQ